MDWFSIVLVILFVILPIIQQVIAAAKKSEGRGAGEELEGESPLPSLDAGPAPAKETSWSDEWTPWPGSEQEAPETLAGREVATMERTVPAVQDVRQAALDQLVQRVSLEKRRSAQPARVAPPLPPPARTRRKGRYDLHGVLHDPAEVRRSLVLSEILGPPVALRPDDRGAP